MRAEPGSATKLVKSFNYESAQSFINAVHLNQLDYLKNAPDLIKVYELSKKQGWHDLHVQSSVLIAELLFRQEKYEKLSSHLQTYLSYKNIDHELMLRLLEIRLKNLSNHEDALRAKELAKQLQTQLDNSSQTERIIILRALAFYFTSIDDLRQTLEVALKGLMPSIESKDFASQGFFLRKITDAYNYLDEKEKAIDYAKKAVIAYEHTKDEHLTSKAYWSLGNVLLETGKADAAVIHFQNALNYFKAVKMQKGISFAQFSIASILFSQGKYEEALTLANENIELAQKANVYDMQLASMILVSDIYQAQNKLTEANFQNDRVYDQLSKFSRSVYKSDFLGKRYELKRKLDYSKDAFEALEQQLFFLRKHLEATSASNIKALQVKYEVKKKEDEILRLAHEKDLDSFKIKEEHQQKLIWRLSTAIAVILVLGALLLVYRLIRERKKFHLLASTDHLTNSPNRRAIIEIAELTIKKYASSIAIVDLDLFKNINDKFGHDVGDAVLIAFSNAAKQTLSVHCQFGRYGGEEWLIAIATTDKKRIEKGFKELAQNFRAQCECIDQLQKVAKKSFSISFSAGVSMDTNANSKLADLIRHADALLYQAKENGRDQIIINEIE